MSETSDLTAALNKMKAAMKDVQSAVDKESNNLSDGANAISDLARNLESRVKERGRIEEEKTKKATQVEKEIAELEERKSVAETTYADKTSNTEQIDKLEDLKKTLENTRDEVTIASKEASDLEKSVNDKKREADKAKSDLQSMKKKHDSEIRSLRESHDKAQDELSWKEAQHKALRLLGNEKAATFPEYKVIEALRQQSTTTMNQLETATQLKSNHIEQILRKLAKKAVIQYDSKAGEVRVLRHLED